MPVGALFTLTSNDITEVHCLDGCHDNFYHDNFYHYGCPNHVVVVVYLPADFDNFQPIVF